MLYTFANLTILIIAIVFMLGMNLVGYIKKKGAFALITMLFSIASLYVHVKQRELLVPHYLLNIILDLVFLGISMVSLLIMDEIETRRTIIQSVFKGKYES